MHFHFTEEQAMIRDTAAAFLAGRPEVDAKRVGGLGICASAGYMSGAALESSHIKAITLVAPWLRERD